GSPANRIAQKRAFARLQFPALGFQSLELPQVRRLIDVLSHARGNAAFVHLDQECQVAVGGLLGVFQLRPVDFHVFRLLAPVHRLLALVERVPSAAERGSVVAAGLSALVEMQMEHLIAGSEYPSVLPIEADLFVFHSLVPEDRKTLALDAVNVKIRAVAVSLLVGTYRHFGNM